MIRFLVAVFTMLLLCQNVGACQDQTNSGDSTNAPAFVEEQDNPADQKPDVNQERTNVENKDVIGNEDASIIQRLSKVTSKANIALFVSALSALFAFLSWWVGKDANKISKKSVIAEYQPYMTFDKTMAIGFPKLRGLPDTRPNQFFAYILSGKMIFNATILVNNVGKTPMTQGSFVTHCQISWGSRTSTGVSRLNGWADECDGSAFHYIGPSNEKSFEIFGDFISDRAEYESSPDAGDIEQVDMSGRNIYFKIWVLFHDNFGKGPRTFYAEYGGIISNDICLIDFREVPHGHEKETDS